MSDRNWGTLWGVGVGPGDPDLVTVKAANLLQRCPVVAFPAGRNGQPGIAEGIVQQWVSSHQIQMPLYFPYVQAAATLEAAWSDAAERVFVPLKKGQDVVFATEGDASFYSTFTYLAQTLQHHHPDVVIQTVPGVCSPLAVAALLGEPLTILRQRLTVLPALYAIAELETAIDQSEVVVLLKVASVYPKIWPILQKRNLLEHSRVVVRATQPGEVVYRDLTAHPDLTLPYFSLMIIRCGP